MNLRRPIPDISFEFVLVRRAGILREEFFGATFYDLDRHSLFYVDRLATCVLIASLKGIDRKTLLSSLNGMGWTNPQIIACVADLYAQELLDFDSTTARIQPIRHFRPKDLSIAYLQAPFVVELEMTLGCYRSCQHCAYNSSPNVDRVGELTTIEWKYALKKLADAGVLEIRFTGGDFLFRSDAIELLQFADGLGLSYHFLSDTVALNNQSLDAVRQLKNLSYVGTSLDGVDAETHDWLRGAGAFELLCSRVRRMTELEIPVLIGSTLHKKNWTQIRGMGRLASALGARFFEMGFLCPVGRAAALRHLVLDPEEVREALSLYIDGVAAKDYKPMQQHYLWRAKLEKAERFSDFDKLIDRLPYQTEWPFSRLRIKPTGVTYTAGKLKETWFGTGINILKDDFGEIWAKSPNLVALRKVGMARRLHSLDIDTLGEQHE
jgi:MoaA/NifB/PqqE/SkfB family radical SAM enzyme